eukprot:Nk52_evm5s331 gene=Nk52_evmTU5s331
MNCDHHVFVHLDTERFYCLPEGYEIRVGDEPALRDIQQVLSPKYTKEQIAWIKGKKGRKGDLDLKEDEEENEDYENPFIRASRSLDGRLYMPGAVGLNNIKRNDYMNVIVQALAQVQPIRDFFLTTPPLYRLENITVSPVFVKAASPLVVKFGELLRKMWNPGNFKGHVSPQEFVNAVSVSSRRRFVVNQQASVIDFLSWFLNEMDKQLMKIAHQREKILKSLGGPLREQKAKIDSLKKKEKGGKDQGGVLKREMKLLEELLAYEKFLKSGRSQTNVISGSFKGNMKITSQKLLPTEQEIAAVREADGTDISTLTGEEEEFQKRSMSSPFMFLTVELPTRPLFASGGGEGDGEDGGRFGGYGAGNGDGGEISASDLIPQVPLMDILKKFDGRTETLYQTHRDSHNKTFELLQPLPGYLIFFFKRFEKNNFFTEKNPTIVNFPIQNLDLNEYLGLGEGNKQTPTVGLKYNLIANVVYEGNVQILEDNKETTKREQKQKRKDLNEGNSQASNSHNNGANMSGGVSHHHGSASGGSHGASKRGGGGAGQQGKYRVHIKHGCTGQWYEIEDLVVKEILPQMMPLTETYLQIWEKKNEQ